MAHIVVVGSFNADLVTYMPALPRIGETVTGSRFVTGPGGKGSNQAVAAARLGADVAFVGRVGTDSFAQIGLNLWQKEGIDTRHVGRDSGHATGIASIFVEDGGEDMIALAPGANHALSPDDIDAAADTIAAADVLVTQLEVPLDTVAYALRIARSKGVITILNPAPAVQLDPALLTLADYLTPNEVEIDKLSSGSSIEQKAIHLLSRPDQHVIITMGAWGAMWVRQDGHGHVESFEVEATDTVGAGDAFNGGLAVALAENRPLESALRFANAVGALAVTRQGAAESMPVRAEVDAFLDAHPPKDVPADTSG